MMSKIMLLCLGKNIYGGSVSMHTISCICIMFRKKCDMVPHCPVYLEALQSPSVLVSTLNAGHPASPTGLSIPLIFLT